MSKQKILIAQKLQSDSKFLGLNQEIFTRIGALVFTGLVVIGATEMVLEHMTVSNPTAGHASNSISELFARGEGKTESARLPEEFDIGMQTALVSGL